MSETAADGPMEAEVERDGVVPEGSTGGAATVDRAQRLPHELAELARGRGIRLRIVRHAETEHNVHHRIQGWSDSPITERGTDQIAAVASALAGERFALAFSSDLPRTRTTMEGILTAQPSPPPVEYLADLREWNFGGHEERPSFDVWSELIVQHGFEVDQELSALRQLAERLSWREMFDGIASLDATGEAEFAAATVLRADAALAHIVRSLAATDPSAARDETGSGEAVLGDTVLGDTVLDDVMPDDAVFDGTVPDDTVHGLVVTHGGFITTLLRQLVGEATPNTILPNCSVTTVSLDPGATEWRLDGVGETFEPSIG